MQRNQGKLQKPWSLRKTQQSFQKVVKVFTEKSFWILEND